MAEISKQETPLPEEMSESNTYNFPNPCSGPTTIRFSLYEPVDVSIRIYDINDRMVWSRSLNSALVYSGVNYVKWDLQNDEGIEVSNGIYFLVIQANDRIVRKKIAVIK